MHLTDVSPLFSMSTGKKRRKQHEDSLSWQTRRLWRGSVSSEVSYVNCGKLREEKGPQIALGSPKTAVLCQRFPETQIHPPCRILPTFLFLPRIQRSRISKRSHRLLGLVASITHHVDHMQPNLLRLRPALLSPPEPRHWRAVPQARLPRIVLEALPIDDFGSTFA